MYQLENTTIKKLPILDRLLIIAILFNSGTALRQNTRIASYTMVILFAIYVIKRRQITRITAKTMAVSFTIVLLIVLQGAVLTGTGSIKITAQYGLILLICIGFSSINTEHNRARLDFMIDCVVVISIISLPLYLLVLAGILPYQQTSQNYYTVLYLQNFYIDSRGILGFRNSAIFWEPGMYQIFLNFSILYYLYNRNLKSYKIKTTLAVLILQVVLTYSTTGYILLALILVYYVITYRNMGMKKTLVLILSCIVGTVALPFIVQNINNKMTVGLSYSSRLGDLTTGLDTFFHNPILGCSIDNRVFSDNYFRSTGMVSGGCSNGLINILIYFGLIGFIVYLVCLVMFVRTFAEYSSNATIIPCAIWLVISLFAEPITLHPFLFFIMGIGISNKNVCLFRTKIEILERSDKGVIYEWKGQSRVSA